LLVLNRKIFEYISVFCEALNTCFRCGSDSSVESKKERLDDITRDHYDESPDVPFWFQDNKPENFGINANGVKIRDYAMVQLPDVLGAAPSYRALGNDSGHEARGLGAGIGRIGSRSRTLTHRQFGARRKTIGAEGTELHNTSTETRV
jgi:hypothetical protein